MKTALMIAIIVLASSAGDVFITKGMKQVGEISTLRLGLLGSIAKRVFANRYFLAGLLMMAVGFFALLAVVSWADMSLVIPATSLSFVASTIGAKLYLKEKINIIRWAGILLVCIGVALLSLPE
ncbi:MAG TPA: EamA family transporter [Blastocatellia bacterium]|nr:EamA family transporter [Blastocatellia bacterium]